MTKLEVAKLVGVLMAAYPSSKANPQTSEVYESMLADLDYAKANVAVRRLLGSAKWMPTIAEIREAVLHADRGPIRAGGDAWGDVLEAVHRTGSYRTPTFADPLVASAVVSLGWSEICGSENQVADRARFIELYDRLTTTSRRELQMPADVRRLPAARESRSLPVGTAALRVLDGGANRFATHEDWVSITDGIE